MVLGRLLRRMKLYRAYFQYKKKEPEQIYFKADGNNKKTIEFSAKSKKPIKFIINSNLSLDVETN